MEEKRVYERVPVDLRVQYHEDSPETYIGRVSNLSMGGMFLKVSNLSKYGTYVFVDIDAESLGKVVWTQGRVVRTTPFGMAIEFNRADTKGLEALLKAEKSRLLRNKASGKSYNN
jgi:hypothetical protein